MTPAPLRLHESHKMSDLPDKCVRCGAVGYDRRTLWHACLYEMDELGLPFKKVDLGEGRFSRIFYTLYVCKGCRAEWMLAIKQWFNSPARHDDADEMPVERRLEILESEMRKVLSAGSTRGEPG
jgi:hypothetical protein